MSDYRRPDYPVDILVRGHENVALTAACLSSIRRNTDPALYQITYVDNGSEPANFSQLVKNNPDVQFVRLPFNHGSVRAINTGLLMALQSPSEFVLLMDNDTEVPSGDSEWLNRFMSYFADDRVGVAGAVSNYVSGMQQAEAAPDTYTRDWKEDSGREGFKEQPDAPVLVSFAMMLRKQVSARWACLTNDMSRAWARITIMSCPCARRAGGRLSPIASGLSTSAARHSARWALTNCYRLATPGWWISGQKTACASWVLK